MPLPVKKSGPRIKILLCTPQPFVGKGFASVLRGHSEFSLAGACDNLAEVRGLIRVTNPGIILIHLTTRISLSELNSVALAGKQSIVLWGDDVTGEFAYQAMQMGVRGILPGAATVDCLLNSLSSIYRGVLCFEAGLIDSALTRKRVSLTPREGQIVSLVAEGFKNKEIAYTLGTTEGTIKAYLYKIFRKLEINDRLDLALYGQRHLFGGKQPLWKRAVERPAAKLANSFIPRSLAAQTHAKPMIETLQ